MSDFEAMAPEWNALFARAGRAEQVFQTFGWNWHWARHYLASADRPNGPRLAIVTGHVNDGLALVMPFAIERRDKADAAGVMLHRGVVGLRQGGRVGLPVANEVGTGLARLGHLDLGIRTSGRAR